MSAWMASGRVLDVIMAAMLLEGLGFGLLFRLRRRGVTPGSLLPNLASGLCLLLAMRMGIAQAWWPFISLSLLGALAGHVVDLRRQWR